MYHSAIAKGCHPQIRITSGAATPRRDDTQSRTARLLIANQQRLR